MNDYYRVRIDAEPADPDITDLAAAFLADAGFESFEPDASGLTAYVRADVAGAPLLAKEVLEDFPMNTNFSISAELVPGRNWNEEWEKHYFNPIVIGGKCVIHSSFHTDVPDALFDIVIDPKMAFGTGHHDTTSQMVAHLLEMDLKGRSVVDVGTGTGILGILAAMLGAESVKGIEIDRGAYENALENVALNKVEMDVIHGDASALEGIAKADLLMANINRNIILADLDTYTMALKPKGQMLLSGFYEREDIPMILKAAADAGLSEIARKVSPQGWAALRLQKN